jgi:hypothetical protein
MLVALSYPLQAHPCRACLHHLTTGWSTQTHQPLPATEAQASDQDDSDIEPDTPVKAVAPWVNSAEMSETKFIGLTTGIIVFGLGIALVIDELETGTS